MAAETSPPTGTLGYILWYTLSGGETGSLDVSREDLVGWFEELGIGEEFLPVQPKAINTFRAVSSDMTASYDIEGHTVELSVREVNHTEDYVTRHVMRTAREVRTGRPNQTRVAELQFFRPARTAKGRKHGTERLLTTIRQDVRDAGGYEFEQIQKFITSVEERYSTVKARLTPQAMRFVIRDYLASLNAIAVKPTGGIYFIHEDRLDELIALKTMIERIPGCVLHKLPLMDSPEQREMLRDAFEDEVIDDVRLLRRDVERWNERNTNRRIPTAKYNEFRHRYIAILNRSSEHATRLDLAQDRSVDALEEARELIMLLHGRQNIRKG